MTDPSVAVHKAIYNALVAALDPIPVYDSVPQDSVYPYVVIDRQDISPFEPLARRRDERFMYLSIWSRYRGQKEVLEILQIIDAALHHTKLPMDLGRMVMCYVDRRSTSRDFDNLTFMGSVMLRIITEHIGRLDFVLLEDSSYMLMEDGQKIVLENAN